MPRRNQGPRLKWLAKRGGYYISWTERGRSRERSTGTADRGKAEAAFAEWMHARGRRGGPSDPSQILITDVLSDYLSERGPKVAAQERIAYAVLALADFWEGLTAAEITPQTCGRYVEERCKEQVRPKSGEKWRRSHGTVRRELGVLRAAINFAHRSGRITRQVAVELPERPEARDRWMTRAEAARLIASAMGFWFAPYSDIRTRKLNYAVAGREMARARLHLPMFVLLGLYTGRRKEALLSLRWTQVDLKSGRIDFEVAGRRRTNKKRGMVRIPARLMPHLRRLRKRGTDLGYVLHIDGRRIGNIKKGFAAAVERAGLEGVTPHTLRHTAATWLMQWRTDPWEAAGFLSMSVPTLLNTYGHHHPDHMQEAANNIGKRPQNVRVIGEKS